jgi:hypothetical protein
MTAETPALKEGQDLYGKYFSLLPTVFFRGTFD